MSHRFPNPKVYLNVMNKWIQILGEEQFSGLDSSTIYFKKRVCSNHFDKNDFSPGSKMLKKCAVPVLNIGKTTMGNYFLLYTYCIPDVFFLIKYVYMLTVKCLYVIIFFWITIVNFIIFVLY